MNDWMVGRAAEGTRLLNEQRVKPLVGSNPTPSAKVKESAA